MAWLLFLDESGHDHRQMPYEVRGGIALQDKRLWPFTRSIQQLERECFGCSLHEFQKELKGSTLLDKKRFKFANQSSPMEPAERQKHARSFLMKGFQHQQPTSTEFCAYGQACIEMARSIFQSLNDHESLLFASVIPRGAGKPTEGNEEFLRKDHVFLLERFFYMLEMTKENGLIVMDGSEKTLDRKFSFTEKAIRTERFSKRGEFVTSQTRAPPDEQAPRNEKRDNAFGASRSSPLGRVSTHGIPVNGHIAK